MDDDGDDRDVGAQPAEETLQNATRPAEGTLQNATRERAAAREAEGHPRDLVDVGRSDQATAGVADRAPAEEPASTICEALERLIVTRELDEAVAEWSSARA